MRGHLRSLLARVASSLALAGLVAGLTLSASAQADGLNSSTPYQARTSRILGIQPVVGAVSPQAPELGSGNLTYHGGPVEHTNTVYAIYWIPSGYSVSANYTSLINRFFGDVSAASGLRTNVYFSDTQYFDNSGKIKYNSTFAGSVTDTDPLPPSGCTDSVTSVCLTDSQINTEVRAQIAKNGWTPNSSTEFFMFTAKGIGSCFDSSSSQCAFTYYCAYHSWLGSGSTATLYANMPYADTVARDCDVGQHPNGDDADATINVTSHEHNETITDEQGNAWYDAVGYEDGDKCAWIFGKVNGSPGSEYNQTINAHNYWMQEEWSNASSACVQKRK